MSCDQTFTAINIEALGRCIFNAAEPPLSLKSAHQMGVGFAVILRFESFAYIFPGEGKNEKSYDDSSYHNSRKRSDFKLTLYLHLKRDLQFPYRDPFQNRFMICKRISIRIDPVKDLSDLGIKEQRQIYEQACRQNANKKF